MSAGIAAAIARWGFWFLLAYGWAWGELTPRRISLFAVVWLLGWLGFPLLTYGDALFTAFVALLDVVLVLMIFKGDVKIS